MTDDFDLERRLAHEPHVRPSSGFAASVMAAVGREAAAPLPIEFPWRRALPGLATAGVVLAALAGLVVFLAVSVDWASPPHPLGPSRPWLYPMAWIALCDFQSVFVRTSLVQPRTFAVCVKRHF